MQVREICAILGVTLTVWGTWDYCLKVRHGKTPALMSWIVFTAATWLSVGSYFWSHGQETVSVWSGLYTAVSAVCNTATLAVVWRAPHVEKRSGLVDRICLTLALVGIALWAWTGDNWRATLAFQSVMVVAYGPIVKNLWTAPLNPEPATAWLINLAAAVAGAVPSLLARDWNGIAFPLRAIFSILAVLGLMTRIHVRARRKR